MFENAHRALGYMALALGIVGFTGHALGESGYCVSCSGPDQTYLCEVTSETVNPSDQAAKLFCVIQLAKIYGHSACSVKSQSGAACPGVRQTLSYTGQADEGFAGGTRDGAAPQSAEGNPLPPDAPPGAQEAEKPKEPGTLVDLTKQAVEQSGEQLKKAGKAVGDATKKTGSFVKENTVKAGETVKEAAKSTGEVVSNAAKSAFKCVTSFFSDCK